MSGSSLPTTPLKRVRTPVRGVQGSKTLSKELADFSPHSREPDDFAGRGTSIAIGRGPSPNYPLSMKHAALLYSPPATPRAGVRKLPALGSPRSPPESSKVSSQTRSDVKVLVRDARRKAIHRLRTHQKPADEPVRAVTACYSSSCGISAGRMYEARLSARESARLVRVDDEVRLSPDVKPPHRLGT